MRRLKTKAFFITSQQHRTLHEDNYKGSIFFTQRLQRIELLSSPTPINLKRTSNFMSGQENNYKLQTTLKINVSLSVICWKYKNKDINFLFCLHLMACHNPLNDWTKNGLYFPPLQILSSLIHIL